MADERITFTMILKDRITPVLKPIQVALESFLTRLRNITRVPVAVLNTGLKAIGFTLKNLTVLSIRFFKIMFNGFRNTIRGIVYLRRVLLSVQSLVTLFIAGAGVKKILDYADAWVNLSNKIRAFVPVAEKAEAIQERLFESAQDARVPLESITTTFQRLLIVQNDIGRSTEEILNFTNLLSKAVTLSGANAQEAASSLLQLSQGLSEGALRGDELRSVLEQVPFVAAIIAEEVDEAISKLRLIGPTGVLTTDLVFTAFLRRQDQINERFERMRFTISQSFTRVNNSLQRFFGTLTVSSGIFDKITSSVINFSKVIDSVTTAAKYADFQLKTLVEENEFFNAFLPGGVFFGSARAQKAFNADFATTIVKPATETAKTVAEVLAEIFKDQVRNNIYPFILSLLEVGVKKLMVFLTRALVQGLPILLAIGVEIGYAVVKGIIDSFPFFAKFFKDMRSDSSEITDSILEMVKALDSDTNKQFFESWELFKENALGAVDVIKELEARIKAILERTNLIDSTAKKPKGIFGRFFEGVQQGAEEALVEFVNIGNVGQNVGAVLADSFLGVSDAIAEAIVGIEDLGTALKRVISDALLDIGKLILRMVLLRTISATIPGFGDFIGVKPTGSRQGGKIKGYDSGGKVFGPAPVTSNQDTVPAMLQPGEWVLRNEATRYYGDRIMAALNSRMIPRSLLAGFRGSVTSPSDMHFNQGGLVGQPAAKAPSGPTPAFIVPSDRANEIFNGEGVGGLLRVIASRQSDFRRALGV